MKKVTFIVVVVFFTTGFTASKRVEALIEKEIKTTFNIENYTKQPVAIAYEMNEKLPIMITDENFFKINTDEKFLGYYYVGQAYGKVDYFDFMVIFDADLIVSKVKILIYREDHGAEIGSNRWLKQFSGKTTERPLEYQKDIAAISGATISAKSLTREVNKLLKTIEILNNKQQL